MIELIFPEKEICVLCNCPYENNDILPICPSCAEGFIFSSQKEAVISEKGTGEKIKQAWEEGREEIFPVLGRFLGLEFLARGWGRQKVIEVGRDSRDSKLTEETRKFLKLKKKEGITPGVVTGWQWDEEFRQGYYGKNFLFLFESG